MSTCIEIIKLIITDVNWGLIIPSLIGYILARNPIKDKYNELNLKRVDQKQNKLLADKQKRYGFVLGNLANHYWTSTDKEREGYNSKYDDKYFNLKQEYDKCWLISSDSVIKSLNSAMNLNNHKNDPIFGELMLSIRKEIFPKTKLKKSDYIIDPNYSIKPLLI